MGSLAVKYRPEKLEDMTSQESVIKILNRQIQSGDIKNCYLFSGASGCGKTTAARAFANAVNENVGSPIEIDAASNNGVDNIKSIVRAANERSVDSKYKIYIVDEAHALTNASWQALLKTIEEPPKFTIFIFCTTDPQKVPATILNRVMRFNFHRISSDKICERLKYICKCEGYSGYDESCDYLSRICNGELRAGIAFLEKCADYSHSISIENVLEVLGNYSYEVFFSLINSIVDGDVKKVLEIVNYFYLQGNDMKIFVEQFLTFCLDVNKYSLFGDFRLTHIPSTYEDKLKFSIGFDNANNYYQYITDKLLVLKNMLKNDTSPKSTIEVVFTQMCGLK